MSSICHTCICNKCICNTCIAQKLHHYLRQKEKLPHTGYALNVSTPTTHTQSHTHTHTHTHPHTPTHPHTHTDKVWPVMYNLNPVIGRIRPQTSADQLLMPSSFLCVLHLSFSFLLLFLFIFSSDNAYSCDKRHSKIPLLPVKIEFFDTV